MMWPKRGAKTKKLDRGRATRNVQWCYVFTRPDGEAYWLPYETVKERGFDKRDGEFFRSKREAARYIGLLSEEQRGLVRGIRRQVPFSLLAIRPDGFQQVICRYFADFVYDHKTALGDWVQVVEDVKGFREDVYKLKKAWFEAQTGQKILET